MKQRIEAMEALAREMVGDGKKPNLFFVSREGTLVLIARDFTTAYDYWRSLPRDVETCLEDRQVGTLADTAPESDEPGARLHTWDDSNMLSAAQRRPEM